MKLIGSKCSSAPAFIFHFIYCVGSMRCLRFIYFVKYARSNEIESMNVRLNWLIAQKCLLLLLFKCSLFFLGSFMTRHCNTFCTPSRGFEQIINPLICLSPLISLMIFMVYILTAIHFSHTSAKIQSGTRNKIWLNSSIPINW